MSQIIKKKIAIRKRILTECIILKLKGQDKDINNVLTQIDNKENYYNNIIKNLDEKYKKYSIIKPSGIFVEIKKQTISLLNNGYNIVFELLNIYDDFVVYYNAEDKSIIQGSVIKKYVIPYNNLLEKANRKELSIYYLYDENLNIVNKSNTNIFSQKDISITDIIISSVYYEELIPTLKPEYYKYAIIREALNIPNDFPKFNIKCGFIGDYVFDKIQQYTDDNLNLNVTSKISHEIILL